MRFVSGFARFDVRRSARVVLALSLCLPVLLRAQTTGSITGTVHDSSGAVIANAQVTVSNTEKGISHTTPSNSAGEYLVAGLGQGSYDITVTAEGFKKFEAKGVALDVAQKARVDVAMQVGATGTEIVVEGTAVAQVETQSSDLTGTVSGKEISQLQLNGRNFTQLVTLVPGVSSQTGQDEGTVGVYGNVSYSVNGGRTEYNNWELDGGDNMDNGSNTTLNVYPSLDAIGEFKVLTSNYGAQYGRSGSGTIEVETKSGTNQFHGDVYEFNRNTAYNARNYFADSRSSYKKNDYGYTIGGPVYIPGVYNKDKQKTFFFWSEEWRKEKVPGKNFNVAVPTTAERGGDFSDVCPGTDCPHQPGTTTAFPGNIVPTSAADQSAVTGLLALIPAPNSGTQTFVASPVLPTNWREELIRVDHNLTSKERLTFRYIHDSWDTVSPTPLWTNVGSFPTIETNFKGPSVSSIARLSSTLSPTLLNEFQMSYTTDHIVLTNVGAWQRGNAQFGDLFGGNGGGTIPGINFVSSGAFGGLGEDPGYIPQGPYNSNPTYTYRDNVIKIIGKHNLQFGAYLVTAQKNELGAELGAGSTPGYLTFNTSNPNSTGNVFADLLNGQIFSFGEQSQRLKYYNRYKILEPYFQDDFHVSSHLTVNLGLRISLFGTYRDKQHFAFNFDPSHYDHSRGTVTNADGTVSFLTADNQPASVTDLPNGIVQCGVTAGVPVGCMKGHLFNPAPRLGFAWDPKGDGKWAVRGGYGVFYEHTNGNEGNTESLENSPPLATTVQQIGIQGYQNIGTGLAPGATLPLSVVAIPNRVRWPYIQQWHLDLQHEIIRNTVATISYVGSKGTHLTRVRDLNQVAPPPFSTQNPNPYKPGEAMGSNDCATGTTPSGVVIPGYTPPPAPNQPADPTKQTLGTPGVNMYIACGNGADFFRPIPGYGNIASIEDAASSTYHGMEFGVRRSVGGLELNFAYTYSHSIDNSSSRQDNDLVNAYAPNSNRASSTFDERHNLNFSYVWDLPFFKQPGLTHTFLGGWQYSGIMDFNTGSPFTVTFGSDNAGVGNGTSNSAAAYADIVGDPNAGKLPTGTRDIQLYNYLAYAAPRGLTFGDSGRNSLRNPRRTNFDMSLFKHFAIKEHLAFEFRAEAFNVFNHTQLGYINGDGGSGANNSANLNSATAGWASQSTIQGGNSNFLQITQAHNPRILQLGAKFIF